MVKATAIIQARMSSTRLPGKVMKQLSGKPVITHIIERLKLCKMIDEIILATSTSLDDDILEESAFQIDVPCYRGSLEDVLARFYFAAHERTQHIVRVCADSPLLDSKIIDSAVEFYDKTNASIVKETGMPLGLGTEVFAFSALEEAYYKADEFYQRDNVTPYIYENFKTQVMECTPDNSHYRLTLDTEEDFIVISEIYSHLYCGKHDFFCDEIVQFLIDNPKIAEVNKHIEQIQVKLNIKTEEPNESL